MDKIKKLLVCVVAVLVMSLAGCMMPLVEAEEMPVVAETETVVKAAVEVTAETITEATAAAPTAPVPEATEPKAQSSEGDGIVLDEKTVYATAEVVNVRSGPGDEFEIIGTVTKGAELKQSGHIMFFQKPWIVIETGTETGYVSETLVSDTMPVE